MSYEGPGLEIWPPREEYDISEFLTERGAKMLRGLSLNMSSGISHPNDEQRFFDFISYCHIIDVEMSETFLTSALVEDAGWDQESAQEISSQYQNLRDFAKAYDAFRKD